MSLRRCATQGCTGTLPAGRGKFCPRCGGTAFVGKPRRGGKVFFFALVAFAIGAVVLHLSRRTAIPPERRVLIEQHDVAARMSGTTSHDEAFEKIVQKALAQHDYEYACQLCDEMMTTVKKEQCLLDTVDAALKDHQISWANRAADKISTTLMHDEALKKIMELPSRK